MEEVRKHDILTIASIAMIAMTFTTIVKLVLLQIVQYRLFADEWYGAGDNIVIQLLGQHMITSTLVSIIIGVSAIVTLHYTKLPTYARLAFFFASAVSLIGGSTHILVSLIGGQLQAIAAPFRITSLPLPDMVYIGVGTSAAYALIIYTLGRLLSDYGGERAKITTAYFLTGIVITLIQCVSIYLTLSHHNSQIGRSSHFIHAVYLSNIVGLASSFGILALLSAGILFAPTISNGKPGGEEKLFIGRSIPWLACGAACFVLTFFMNNIQHWIAETQWVLRA
jgi:hypothetical protein